MRLTLAMLGHVFEVVLEREETEDHGGHQIGQTDSRTELADPWSRPVGFGPS